MQTVFDKALSDFLVLAMLQNTSSLVGVTLSQIFDNFSIIQAKLISLSVYFFLCATLIHLSASCFTRLACIYLVGTMEYVSGK